MRTRFFAASLLATVVLVGCVVRTEHKIDAHITVDIRHIQEQAAGVLDFVEGKSDALPGLEGGTSWLDRTLQILDPTPMAHAQGLKTASATVKEIATRMQARNGEVSALKASGCFGETNRGYIELRECGALGDADARNTAQKLLSEENKDRKALYNEIARLNEDANVSVSTVEAVYAGERLARAKSGEVYQLPPAGAELEKFKATAAGKALGDKAQASAWVSIP